MSSFYFIIAVTYVAADKWQLKYYGVKISHLKGGGVLAHCLGDQLWSSRALCTCYVTISTACSVFIY